MVLAAKSLRYIICAACPTRGWTPFPRHNTVISGINLATLLMQCSVLEMMCPFRNRGFGLESAWKVDVRLDFDCFAVSFTIYCIESWIGQKSLHFCYPSLRFISLISVFSWVLEFNGFTVTEKCKQIHVCGHDMQWYNVKETLRVGLPTLFFAKKQSTSRLRPVRCSTSIGIY